MNFSYWCRRTETFLHLPCCAPRRRGCVDRLRTLRWSWPASDSSERIATQSCPAKRKVEDKMKSEQLPTHRQCKVELENKLSEYTLHYPQVYTESGTCEDPLPPVLKPSESGSALFKKTPYTACGAVGVFMYELLHVPTNENIGKIGVLYSNPFDFIFYSNWYGVGVFDMDKSCDYALYELMYYGGEKGFVRGKASGSDLTYSDLDVEIKASMSDEYQPVIKIQFLNK